ncbi:MAG: helix-turn-helix domain-containing protein [Oceanipulchritudo sp.]
MIGERLEEARKRKGVSIREAAEATKIRGDYLLEMEDNSFDINLPQIYVRGFLKNYARFLKLDPNKILTDYDAQMLRRRNQPVATSTRSRGESLGHVEIPSRKEPLPEEEPEGKVVITEAPEEEGPEPELRFNLDRKPESHAAPPPPTLDREATRHDQEAWNENKTLYMKIGIVFAAILAVSIILIILIQLLTGKPDSPEINPELASRPATGQVQTPVPPPQVELGTDTLVISASDNVTLIVEQTIDRKRLYSGSLNAGEQISLDKEGPVSIRFTNGSAVTIEKDGRQFRPGQSGVGRTVVE